MNSADIRERFLKFFESKKHMRVPSSPLAPDNDPTLLFCNSGMVQFKDVFLGFDKRPYKTAVTAQRCLRAGGKHNDLQNVGYTSRHHTFFEMLGNFSFGEYFKEAAIPYAWEFLTSPEGLNLPREHLWITVFGGGHIFGKDFPTVPPDEDAAAIWKKTLIAAGFDEATATQRIVRIPTTDNFWMMGDTGPCGPCSEIFYDKDINAKSFRGTEEKYADECVEVWNLVFMEFNRDDSGTLAKLPAPCVDTGMGLERISAVMQNVNGNYDIDIFQNLLAAVDKTIVAAGGQSCNGDYQPSHRVIADHIRAAAYLIADGILPDNEGRGYVLRKIIRRALIHGCRAAQNPQLGEQIWFCKLADDLPNIMGGAGDMLHPHIAHIKEILAREERGFFKNFLQGREHLLKKIGNQKPSNNSGVRFSGAAAFELYDTYGFPAEATIDEVIARGFDGINDEEFEKCMNEQRTRSRAATKLGGGQKTVAYDGTATEFTGYAKVQDDAKIVALFVNGESVNEVSSGEVLIILNRTPFYAESGGQVGDIGEIRHDKTAATALVRDTQKVRADVWGHLVTINGGALAVGDSVICSVNEKRRQAISNNHSATHLMHAALQKVLGNHVRQKGSLVSATHLRFDFSHNAPMEISQLREVEDIVNHQIRANHETTTELLSFTEALSRGATALFGEKYGDVVRMVSIDPNFSIELCGGIHTERAGNIGLFYCLGESGIAAGVRRIEAVTAESALQQTRQTAEHLQQIATLFKSPPEQAPQKVVQLRASLKDAQKQIAALQASQTAVIVQQLSAQAQQAGDETMIIGKIANADIKILQEAIKHLRGKHPQAAILLAGDGGGKAAVVASSKSPRINAKQWIDEAATIVQAKGGGKNDYAQCGGGDVAQIDAALAAATTFVNQAIQ